MFCQAGRFFVQFFGCPLEVSEASIQEFLFRDGVPILGFLWQPTQ